MSVMPGVLLPELVLADGKTRLAHIRNGVDARRALKSRVWILSSHDD